MTAAAAAPAAPAAAGEKPDARATEAGDAGAMTDAPNTPAEDGAIGGSGRGCERGGGDVAGERGVGDARGDLVDAESVDEGAEGVRVHAGG